MNIGEVAKKTQLSPETIRYYEKIGFLPNVARSSSHYRHYDDSHVTRLNLIRHCRLMEMTQEEIRQVIDVMEQNDCSAVADVLAKHIEHINQRITALTWLKQHLAKLLRCHQESPSQACAMMTELKQSPNLKADETPCLKAKIG